MRAPRALFVALAALALTAGAGAQIITASFVATTASSGTSPRWMGVNVGHTTDPSWVQWISRLGANAARSFGLNAMGTTLQTFATRPPASGVWGSSLSNAPVTSLASFQTAVSQLRTTAGRDFSGGSWPNPPRWAAFDTALNTTVTTQPDGLSLDGIVRALVAAGVEPLLVSSLNCNQFAFTTLSQSQVRAPRIGIYGLAAALCLSSPSRPRSRCTGASASSSTNISTSALVGLTSEVYAR